MTQIPGVGRPVVGQILMHVGTGPLPYQQAGMRPI